MAATTAAADTVAATAAATMAVAMEGAMEGAAAMGPVDKAAEATAAEATVEVATVAAVRAVAETVAAMVTAAVVVGAMACACESPCTTRQRGSKSERGMRTALDARWDAREREFDGRAHTISDEDAEEEAPEGKTPRGIEPLQPRTLSEAGTPIRAWDVGLPPSRDAA